MKQLRWANTRRVGMATLLCLALAAPAQANSAGAAAKNPAEQMAQPGIPARAWVAIAAGAAGLGASTYFVSKINREEEASDAQVALITGTAGLISMLIGLSYVLGETDHIRDPILGTPNGPSASVALGAGTLSIFGKF